MYPASEGASTSANPVTHERIGRYDLLRRLGSGGMAEVHLVRAAGIEGFEKLLVLKRILPHLAADPHFVRMFLAEARLAAILDHPNVVQVFDLGRDEQDFFFTMEFVYGETLHSAIRAARRAGEKFPYELAVAVAVGAAAGLHYAHERVGFDGQPLNIVHRDVSPTNVMITYDGCVKVADFGIAKVANRTDVTRAGMRKGKVPYMSPEQCRAQKLDRRSDVFALGIVLFECSTMHRLFDGDNEFGVMNRIVNGDFKPPSTMRSGYPKELERIVMTALSVDRSRRYGSAQEMMLDLERFARDNRLDATPSGLGRWMHRMFQPEPFPWGALQQAATATSSAAGLSTLSDAQSLDSLSGSGPGIPQSHPGVTPSSLPSWASPPSHPSYIGPRTGVKKGNRALKGIAIGLGGLAAAAAIGVGGAIFHAKVIVPRSEAEPAAAPAAAADEDAPSQAERAATSPEEKAEAEAAPEADPEAEAEADEAEPDEAQDAEDEDEEAEAEPQEGVPEEEVVLVEEPDAPKSRAKSRGKTRGTSKSKPEPKPDKKKKKKKKGMDIDAFMPGG